MNISHDAVANYLYLLASCVDNRPINTMAISREAKVIVMPERPPAAIIAEATMAKLSRVNASFPLDRIGLIFHLSYRRHIFHDGKI